jgi:hypothetical protein
MADVTPATAAPVDAHTYKFNVSMSCGGCSGAVDRVLKKLAGSSPSLPYPLAAASRSVLFSGPRTPPRTALSCFSPMTETTKRLRRFEKKLIV